MSQLERVLIQAAELRASELWVAPSQMARVRIGHDWKNLGSEIWGIQETKALLCAPLSESDRRELNERSIWNGSVRVSGRPFQLQLQITDQGVAGCFRWNRPETQDWDSWNLPAHLIEILQRTRGLTLLAGPVRSGKSSLLGLFAQKLSQSGQQLVHFYSSDPTRFENLDRVSTFPIQSLSHLSHSPADLVLVDEPAPSQWSALLQFAQEGRHVVMTMSALHLFAATEKWRNYHLRTLGESGLNELQVGMGLKLISALEAPLVPASEILLVTQALREKLTQGQWKECENEMRGQAEKTGMRTLNQSLLQLLLRRKIEMRMAFQESLNPDEFDLLLKKVGI